MLFALIHLETEELYLNLTFKKKLIFLLQYSQN